MMWRCPRLGRLEMATATENTYRRATAADDGARQYFEKRATKTVNRTIEGWIGDAKLEIGQAPGNFQNHELANRLLGQGALCSCSQHGKREK